jgi:hypothetical protein
MQISSFILSSLAMVLYAAALVLWILLFRKINLKVWSMVAIGFGTLLIHRALEMSNHDGILSSSTAVIIAVANLLTAYTIYKSVQRIDAIRKTLQITETESVAAKLAEHLAKLHAKIEYYERKADEYQIPKYVEK